LRAVPEEALPTTAPPAFLSGSTRFLFSGRIVK